MIGMPKGRTCTHCQLPKPVAAFSVNGTHPDGTPRLRSRCRACEGSKTNTKPKACSVCKKIKPASDFRERGTHPYCRPCHNERNYASKKPGGTQHKKWITLVSKRYRRLYTNSAEFRLKVRARGAVRRALKAKKLIRPKRCSVCRLPKRLHAHHHRGYEREHWLDVVWMCAKCHYREDNPK